MERWMEERWLRDCGALRYGSFPSSVRGRHSLPEGGDVNTRKRVGRNQQLGFFFSSAIASGIAG